MSQQPLTASNSPDRGFNARWAAWQARGAANDVATRRKLFVVASILALGAAILGGAWSR